MQTPSSLWNKNNIYHEVIGFNDLVKKILNFDKKKKYKSFDLKERVSEENTIKLFKKIFLNKNYEKNSINIVDYFFIFLFY